MSTGLAITQGNTTLYRRLLVKFRANYSEFSSEFQDAQKSADTGAATRLSHTLKGVAGNIGATQIQQAAEALKQASLSGQSDLEELLQHVVDALEPVLDNLAVLDNALTSKVSKAAAGKFDSEQVKELLSRVRELLKMTMPMQWKLSISSKSCQRKLLIRRC